MTFDVPFTDPMRRRLDALRWHVCDKAEDGYLAALKMKNRAHKSVAARMGHRPQNLGLPDPLQTQPLTTPVR